MNERTETPRTWTQVHATTMDPAADGIWHAIDQRIGWGYSGISGARESEANDDIRRAIAAIRADVAEDVRALVEALRAYRSDHDSAWVGHSCWSHLLDPRPTAAARNIRVVKRVCEVGCPCPICLEADAMVAAFNGWKKPG